MNSGPALASYDLYDMAWVDVAEYLQNNDTVLVPIGSLEQHGEHLPLGTDAITAEEVTKRASMRARTVRTPTLWTGYTPHHMRSPGEGTGTVTLRASTLAALLSDVMHSLIYHGFNRIIIVTGHGSNGKIIDPILRTVRYKTGALVALYTPYAERYLGLVKDIVEGPPEETPGWHAGELETSQVLAHNPSLVHTDRYRVIKGSAPGWLPDTFEKNDASPSVKFAGYEYLQIPFDHMEITPTGLIGNPARATPEKGERALDAFANYLTEAIAELRKADVTVKDREWPERASW
jgi:creatinine amidohydrolase